MKPTNTLLAVLYAASVCGCASVLTSTREKTLPNAALPMTGVRYYLPKAKLKISASWDKGIPDGSRKFRPWPNRIPRYCFRLNYTANAFFDDDVTVGVDPATGLLCNASATTTDQSINSLGTVISSIGAAFTFGVPLQSAASAARGNDETQKIFDDIKKNAFASSFSEILVPGAPSPTVYLVSPDENTDSTNSPRKSETKQALEENRCFAKYDFELKRVVTELPGTDTNRDATTFNGIVVRVPVAYNLSVKGTFFSPLDHYQTAHQLTNSFVVLLPDETHNYFLPLDRRPFVTTTTNILLVGGMVESYERNRPSMVAGIVGVPKTLIGALVPLPLDIKPTQQNNVQTSSKSGGSSTNSASKD